MINSKNDKEISLAKAALIAGLGLLVMTLTVPIAEFYIFPRLISDDETITASNIASNINLFTVSIFLHFITLICDIIVAWALYIFLKPIHQQLSLLTAWFRLIYTAMYLVALANLIKVVNYAAHIEESNNATTNIMHYISSFKLEWSFGLIIFALYLLLLGYMILKATYIPRVFGILVIVAGFGYLVHTLGAFFFPTVNIDFLFFTFFGELVFMVWLLVKGTKTKAAKSFS